MADLTKLIKILQLWQEVEEKSTSASPEVGSASPPRAIYPDGQDISVVVAQEQNKTRLAISRGNMYARFIRMSEQYNGYINGTNNDYEILRTCVYGQLREDKKNGLL